MLLLWSLVRRCPGQENLPPTLGLEDWKMPQAQV